MKLIQIFNFLQGGGKRHKIRHDFKPKINPKHSSGTLYLCKILLALSVQEEVLRKMRVLEPFTEWQAPRKPKGAVSQKTMEHGLESSVMWLLNDGEDRRMIHRKPRDQDSVKWKRLSVPTC